MVPRLAAFVAASSVIYIGVMRAAFAVPLKTRPLRANPQHSQRRRSGAFFSLHLYSTLFSIISNGVRVTEIMRTAASLVSYLQDFFLAREFMHINLQIGYF